MNKPQPVVELWWFLDTSPATNVADANNVWALDLLERQFPSTMRFHSVPRGKPVEQNNLFIFGLNKEYPKDFTIHMFCFKYWNLTIPVELLKLMSSFMYCYHHSVTMSWRSRPPVCVPVPGAYVCGVRRRRHRRTAPRPVPGMSPPRGHTRPSRRHDGARQGRHGSDTVRLGKSLAELGNNTVFTSQKIRCICIDWTVTCMYVI